MAHKGNIISRLPLQTSRPQHIHVIGICGTAMASIALLAQEKGWRVTGSDAGIYPPMSETLALAGINVLPFSANNLTPKPDLCLVGNAISRGNIEVETVLDQGIRYTSGPAFIGDSIVPNRHAVVVAGTHGKTSTASLLAFVLAQAGQQLGFMIGGIPEDFTSGACLGEDGTPFVLEGDEYDTAFFDKRSKFLHYHARTLILNNLEYDHADIFPDLATIKQQFAYLLRTVPATGTVIVNADDDSLADVVAQGCWTPCIYFSHRTSHHASAWQWQADSADGRHFSLWHCGSKVIQEEWAMIGEHQVANACAVAAAAQSMGIALPVIAQALRLFKGVRRRMTLVNTINGIRLFDDFAHHPTAIRGIVQAAKASVKSMGRLWVILEPRSNTMRSRMFQHSLASCFDHADYVLCMPPASRGQAENKLLDVHQLCRDIGSKATVASNHTVLANTLMAGIQNNDDVVILSNGGVAALHDILDTVRTKVKPS